MDARKVIEMGGGTLLVSLPKEWTRRNGVHKGATLAVDELSARKLIVRPIEDVADEPREIDIEYPREGFAQVADDLTGAYLLGYDVIRIVGERAISREDRRRLKAAMARLVGLEIMDEDSKRVTLQFLLESSVIVPERIVRRMVSIIDGMLVDIAEGVTKGDQKLLTLVGERDDEVDRLYFLLVRAIRAAIMRPELAESYGLTPVDVLDYRVLASFLESAGDAISELSQTLEHLVAPSEAARGLAECVVSLTQMIDLGTQAFISRRTRRTRTENATVQALGGELSKKLESIAQRPGAAGVAVAEALGAIERVSSLLVDISDLAVTTQTVH